MSVFVLLSIYSRFEAKCLLHVLYLMSVNFCCNPELFGPRRNFFEIVGCVRKSDSGNTFGFTEFRSMFLRYS